MRMSAMVSLAIVALAIDARAQRPPPFFEADELSPAPIDDPAQATRAEPGLLDYAPTALAPTLRRVHEAAPEPSIRMIWGAAVGGGYRSLYGPAFAAGVVDLQIGLERLHLEMLGHITVEAGAVVPRIPITQLRFGVSVRGIWRRLRVGAGFRMGWLSLARVTTGELLGAVVLSPFISFSGDAFVHKRAALYLGAEGGVDLTIFATNSADHISSDGSWVLTGLAGARF